MATFTAEQIQARFRPEGFIGCVEGWGLVKLANLHHLAQDIQQLYYCDNSRSFLYWLVQYKENHFLEKITTLCTDWIANSADHEQNDETNVLADLGLHWSHARVESAGTNRLRVKDQLVCKLTIMNLSSGARLFFLFFFF
jgi:hypothetical protein